MKPKRPSVRDLPAPDDVSVSDSICSGVLDEDESGGGGESGASEMPDLSFRDSFGSKSGGEAPVEAADAPAPRETRNSSLHRAASEGNGGRKDRAKGKPSGSRRGGRKLKKSYSALEQRLAETTERLTEADSRAASKIDSLESQLREAERGAVGGEDQSRAIRTLGRKLIRQATVIKKQKEAAAQYKMRLGAMEEEMAMQDERDAKREGEYAELQERYDSVNEQKVKMENFLQENAKEIADLKIQAKRDAKRITTIMRLGAMEEEMAMQDERDAQREEEYAELQERYDSVNEQNVKMENLLQENAKEIADLKSQAKKNAKRITTIMRLRAMEEDMAMQDERDAQREEEYAQLQDRYGDVNEQKVKMENLLQENAEEVADLKGQAEKDAKKIIKLELKLKQKDAMLDRVTKQASDKPLKINEIEDKPEEKNDQVDRMAGKLREERSSVENMKKDLESANAELEELRREHSWRKTQSVFKSWIQGVGEVTGLKILELELRLKQKNATLDRVTKERSDKSLEIAELKDELEEKNSQVDSMREKLKEGRLAVENMKRDSEQANAEKEKPRRALSLCKVAEGTPIQGGGGDEGNSRRKSVLRNWIHGVVEVTGLKTLELELKLKQKEAMLDKMTKEGSKKSLKITELEDELEENNSQVDSMREKLKGERISVEIMKKDLESANSEMEELRCKHSSHNTADGTGVKGCGGGEGDARRHSGFRSWIQGVGEVTGLITLELERKLKQKEAMLDKVTKEGSDKSLKIAELEDELQEKNSQVEIMGDRLEEGQSTVENMKKDLESANAKHDENIKALRSEMVKMSSTYKQDSYLKRKEIVKLKQKNAEAALERRGLEKAITSVVATQNRGQETGNDSCPTLFRRSSHDMMESSDEMTEALHASMGDLAPYVFPSVKRSNLTDSKLVMDSTFTSTLNIFDTDDEEGEEGRKGELPEEC